MLEDRVRSVSFLVLARASQMRDNSFLSMIVLVSAAELSTKYT